MLPTDTVYGIGADAFSADAVQGLLDAKDRGRDMPPPVLIGDASLIRALATDVPDAGPRAGRRALARAADHRLPHPAEPAHGPGRRRRHHRPARPRPPAGPRDPAPHRPAGRQQREHLRPARRPHLRRGRRAARGPGRRSTSTAGARWARGGLPSTIVDFTRHDDGQVLRRGALGLETLRRSCPGCRPRRPGTSQAGPDRRRDRPSRRRPSRSSTEPATRARSAAVGRTSRASSREPGA